MHLVQFDCHGFRALAGLIFKPAVGLNVIYGDNAQGKTSLLEAILYSATSKSHRTTVEADLVQRDADGFQLRAAVQRRDRAVTIEAYWWHGAKRFKVNGVAQTRVSDILGQMSVVLFSPEDLVLVKGTAGHRRRFADMELAQITPRYLNALQRYRQVLRQRNELLRNHEPAGELLDVWDTQLEEHGDVLIRERAAWVEQLAGFAAAAYRRITDGEDLSLLYRPDVPSSEALGAVLAKTRPADVRRGMTTRGPHRDDLEVHVAGQSARSFGSQGQQKTAALALKLAELELVRERTGEYPILMLDEALSELDERRSRLLFDTLGNGVQCLLTTANVTKCEALFGSDCALHYLERGALETR